MARWAVRIALALLLLVHVGACQALTGADPYAATTAPSAACQHGGPADDVLCESAPTVVGSGQRSAAGGWWASGVVGALVVLGIRLLAVPSRGLQADCPRWVRRPLAGWHLLLSVGIARI